MILRQLRNVETSSFTYVVGDKKHLRAVVIDPLTAHVDRDLHLLWELALTPEYVLLTRRDPDRDGAARVLRDRTGARIVAGEGAANDVDFVVKGGDTLKFGRHEVLVLGTPGASKGSVSYLIGKRVFTGDVLSVRACGRGSIHQNPSELFDSVVNVLFALPDDTLVYPTHDEGGVAVTTMGAERRFNPDFVARDRASFVAKHREATIA